MQGHHDRPKFRACNKCGWQFVSPDPSRVAKCRECRSDTDDYEPRSGGSNRTLNEAVRSYRNTS